MNDWKSQAPLQGSRPRDEGNRPAGMLMAFPPGEVARGFYKMVSHEKTKSRKCLEHLEVLSRRSERAATPGPGRLPGSVRQTPERSKGQCSPPQSSCVRRRVSVWDRLRFVCQNQPEGGITPPIIHLIQRRVRQEPRTWPVCQPGPRAVLPLHLFN